jgi:CBS domain-containing protein
MGAPVNDRFETDPEHEKESRETRVRQNLLTVPIQSLQPRPAVTVSPRTSIAEAVSLMNREKIGAVLVVNLEKLVGIFTERDVLTKIAGRGLDFTQIFVADYMTADPETLRVESQMAYALNMMAVGGFRHVPLVDDAHRPVGMISMRDIVEHIAELFPKDVLNLPIDPDHAPKNQWGG